MTVRQRDGNLASQCETCLDSDSKIILGLMPVEEIPIAQ